MQIYSETLPLLGRFIKNRKAMSSARNTPLIAGKSSNFYRLELFRQKRIGENLPRLIGKHRQITVTV